GHLLWRLDPLHFSWRSLDGAILDDQRKWIVIATEQREEAPPCAGRPEVRGEFTIDPGSALLGLDLGEVRLPIGNLPGGERRHHLLALLPRHLEHRAVAPCMTTGSSPAIELQHAPAAAVPQDQ